MTPERLLELLRLAVQKGASDVHLEVAYAPFLRIRGELYPTKLTPLTRDVTVALAQKILGAEHPFFAGLRNEVDKGFGIDGVARVRASVFRQRGSVGLVFRLIPWEVPALQGLGLPAIIETLAYARNGLLLVTGATGNGKSTTIASLLDHMNRTAKLHIVTVEDPIEYHIKGERSVVIQREVGVDTDSFAGAIRAAMRQDPDVIMVGETRDYETADACLQAAETGHLVISSLHTPDVARTIGRFVGIFTGDEQVSVRTRLADNLKGIVCQRLVPRQGAGLVPATEVLLATRPVQEAIRDGSKLDTLPELMRRSRDDGMHTFDQHLAELCRSGLINTEVAARWATSPSELRRELMMAQGVA